jgi:single-strand DNA-binding protein
MLNSVIMMGRLTDNPELRQTPQGVNVCSFTIAVDRSFVKQGEQRQADFFDVVAWRGQADFVSRFFRKGQMIAVQGRMETRTYDDRNGVRRKAFTIVAESLHFADSKKDSNPSTAPYDNGSQVPPVFENAGSNDFREIEAVDDDLPF